MPLVPLIVYIIPVLKDALGPPIVYNNLYNASAKRCPRPSDSVYNASANPYCITNASGRMRRVVLFTSLLKLAERGPDRALAKAPRSCLQ